MSKRRNSTIQNLDNSSVHDWYRFVLAYPDHLVAELIRKFNIRSRDLVLDPFVGTGTTLVECKKLGISSIGIDANPVTAFASRVKTNWDIDLCDFDTCARELLEHVQAKAGRTATPDSTPHQLVLENFLEQGFVAELEEVDTKGITDLIPKGAISSLPLRKILVARQKIDTWPHEPLTELFRLALASIAVEDMSNLGFGPEIYVKTRKKEDADLYGALSRKLNKIRRDLLAVQQLPCPGKSAVYQGDARYLVHILRDQLVDHVITSPPYPNEKDYTRITRLELVLLAFVGSRADLQLVKKHMIRSHTRNIYKGDNDSALVAGIPEITALAETIERARVERGATSGFEKLYHRVVTEYFGGMYRVLEQLQQTVRSGGKVALVVGDQRSFFQVPIHTAHLLSVIARRELDYEESERITWRTRLATATRHEVEEHILVLQRR